MIDEPGATFIITWDEGGKYMLICGARMVIVGVNLETQETCSTEERQTILKNAFKLRIESGESASSFTTACNQLRTFHPLKVSLSGTGEVRWR